MWLGSCTCSRSARALSVFCAINRVDTICNYLPVAVWVRERTTGTISFEILLLLNPNQERAHGPQQIFSSNTEEELDGAEFDPDKLRQYELDRLRYVLQSLLCIFKRAALFRYYFAVIVCDSVSTADAIYSSCDGLEFERSGNKLDLRFVPRDVEFAQAPR